MGWSFLATLLTGPDAEAVKGHVQAELVPMFDELARDLFDEDPTALPAPSLSGEARALAEGHGYLAARDEYAIFRAAVDDVWIPGLAGLGLDPSALRGRYPAAAS
jgi:hypothetical protein